MKHESDVTELLSTVIHEHGGFGLQHCRQDEISERHQDLICMLLSRLLRIWQEIANMDKSQEPRGELEGPASEYIVAADFQRIKSLLEEVGEWNGRLERTVQALTWALSISSSSPQKTMNNLDAIANDPRARRLGWVTPAHLRKIVLAVGNPQVPRSELPVPYLKLEDNSILRSKILSENLIIGYTATGNRARLVEFFPYERVCTLTAKSELLDHAEALRRIEQLSALFHINQDPSFRLPFSSGYYHDSQQARYGIVFNPLLHDCGQLKVVTLENILFWKPSTKSNRTLRPDLGSRFKLAYTLTLSLSKIQSIGWYHQGIRSENVIFVSTADRFEDSKDICWDEPWWVGYSTARPDTFDSIPGYDPSPVRNWYRHPDRWGQQPKSFNKVHDIYSIGVVLLEIGIWAPISKSVTAISLENSNRDQSGEAARQKLVSLAKNGRVADLMGQQYTSIVELCLQGNSAAFGVMPGEDDDDDSLLQKAFLEQVVDPIRRAAELV